MSRPGRICRRGKGPSTHCTGHWVDPTAGMDTEARIYWNYIVKIFYNTKHYF